MEYIKKLKELIFKNLTKFLTVIETIRKLQTDMNYKSFFHTFNSNIRN